MLRSFKLSLSFGFFKHSNMLIHGAAFVRANAKPISSFLILSPGYLVTSRPTDYETSFIFSSLL